MQTSTSIGPNPAFASATRRARSSFDEMVASTAMAPISPTTASQASRWRDDTTTRVPCWASRSAIARPVPRDDPATTATLPERSNSDTALLPRGLSAALRPEECLPPAAGSSMRPARESRFRRNPCR